MSDRPESDGTVWTPPPSAGDLKREYEEMGRDRDGLVEKIAEAMFISLRWRKDIDCAELARAAFAVVERERNSCACEFRPDEQLDPTVECLYHRNLRERAVDAEEKHRYWHERYDREVSALRERPPLTEEEANALLVHIVQRSVSNEAQPHERHLDSAFQKLEALASSTTEEQERG